MVGWSKTTPSSTPYRWAKEPAARLRTMTSRGTMETFFTRVSRSLSSRTKWVGMPASSMRRMRWLVIWLLMTPLPAMVPFFWPLKAVASSL